MKRLFPLIASLLIPMAGYAGVDGFPLELDDVKWTNSTQVTATSGALYGYLESVEVVLKSSGAQTNYLALAIVTNSGAEASVILFTNAVTASLAPTKIRFPTYDSTATILNGLTNAYERYPFCGEQIKASAWASAANQTNDIRIEVKIEK